MIFKDRQDAGIKLLVKLYQDPEIKKNIKKVIVISLLRGGIIVGDIIARGLQVKHLPIVVAKIPAPHNPELAIGALCFDIIYLEKKIVDSLHLDRAVIRNQIKNAGQKFNSYCKRFNIKAYHFLHQLKNKVVVLTDDGIATGSTANAATLYIKSRKPKSMVIALPVSPIHLSIQGTDKQIILYKDENFRAVSQYYKNFRQVEDVEVKRILKLKLYQNRQMV